MKTNPISVAVIDDDESFSRAIGRLLRAAGFAPSIYSSAEAFLRDSTHVPPDCLVLDIHLGGMSGVDLRRRLTALGQTTPVIFVTAHDELKTREEARQVGSSAYLCKPVSAKLLVEAINNAIFPTKGHP
jgi:FixJ family two-component response regulator